MKIMERVFIFGLYICAIGSGVASSSINVYLNPGYQSQGDSEVERVSRLSDDTGTKPKCMEAPLPCESAEVTKDAPAITREIAEKVARSLLEQAQKEGFEKEFNVKFSRTEDDVNKSNGERSEEANAANADCVCSIYLDAVPPSLLTRKEDIAGVSVLVQSEHQVGKELASKSRKLGEMIFNEAINSTEARARRIVEREDLTVLNWCKCPAVSIMVGFITNTKEWESLNSDEYQNKLAAGIAKGILDYFENEGKIKIKHISTNIRGKE
jgi:N-acetylmuramoyl-L-alanine amidase